MCKISLILPYWDRQEAANKAFASLEKYSDLDMEVIVVDDGNRRPFVVPDTKLNVRVINLPLKLRPKSPLTAWNAGVRQAHGEIIILSCVEIIHESPVIGEMVKQLEDIGESGYVLAAAWCPDDGIWHCHSTISVPTCPKGTGIGFTSALYKSLYLKAGGFDEEYREGAGYEDRDFIYRLVKAGAKFVTRDDLAVIHPKTGATIQWEPGAFDRNEKLYYSKWPEALEALKQTVTFLCLKAGKAYGSEYVNILKDMISRNLSKDILARFVCMTDDIQGLTDGIEIIKLPEDLETWWGKLYMFKRGLFRDGERIVFMDLDTLVIGSLDEIVKYEGQFATLKDFYHPQQLGPAVILWEAGEYASAIWDEWVAEGKPRHPMGDLWWLNNLDQGRFRKDIDKLQDLFPNKFVSFKADCNPYPPIGTSIVCFHGQPKPANCMVEWVADVWKIGGSGMVELDAVSNTVKETVAKNIRHSLSLGFDWLHMHKVHEGQAVIVAGGPSIKDTLPEIHYRHGIGQTIIAVNGTAKFLNENGIIPDIHIIIDARPENALFIKESNAKSYFLASQCAPEVFDTINDCTLFHMNTEGIQDVLPKDREANLVSSGTTVGLAALVVAYMLGYRKMHLHGFDSSFEENHHAYQQIQNDADRVIEVSVSGEKFKSTPWMVKQAQQFQELVPQLVDDDCIITVAGSGLLPFIARQMS